MVSCDLVPVGDSVENRFDGISKFLPHALEVSLNLDHFLPESPKLFIPVVTKSLDQDSLRDHPQRLRACWCFFAKEFFVLGIEANGYWSTFVSCFHEMFNLNDSFAIT